MNPFMIFSKIYDNLSKYPASSLLIVLLSFCLVFIGVYSTALKNI